MAHFDFEKLDAYKAAIEFVTLSGEVIGELPPGNSNLADQLRRAATSITLNIAEGSGEFSPGDKARFYRFARRSATECAAIYENCKCLGMIKEEKFTKGRELLLRIVQMLVKMARLFEQTGAGSGSGSGSKTTNKSSHRPWQPPPRRPPSYK